MVRSRLPLPSLLGIFHALLMLCPELVMGDTGLSDLPVTDPGVQRALAFIVEQYNADRLNYYWKPVEVLKVQSQEPICYFKVTLSPSSEMTLATSACSMTETDNAEENWAQIKDPASFHPPNIPWCAS